MSALRLDQVALAVVSGAAEPAELLGVRAPGGGTRHRFLDENGKPPTQRELTALGVIKGAP